MKPTTGICVLLLVGVGSLLRAADSKTDEAAIRAEITSDHRKYTDDVIFWSGAFKRPFVAPDKGEKFPGEDSEKRSNTKTTTEVQRIEVSASGDLAYEFSYGTLEYDLAGPPQTHKAFKNAILRVWKKVDGQWKVAAAFARPLDIPFEDSATVKTSK